MFGWKPEKGFAADNSSPKYRPNQCLMGFKESKKHFFLGARFGSRF
jgi:hypothetical protein